MSGFLLDTNVLSEFNRRGEPDHRVEQWLMAVVPESVYISVITFGEIRLGIELLPPGKRRLQLEQWLDRDFRQWFGSQFLPVDEPIVRLWASLTAQRHRKGKALANLDGLLAATALHHRLTLVTRNVRDFQEVGLSLLNPWES